MALAAIVVVDVALAIVVWRLGLVDEVLVPHLPQPIVDVLFW